MQLLDPHIQNENAMRAAWKQYLKTNPMSCIIDPSNNSTGGLYLGSVDAAKDISLLKRYKIGAVLTVAGRAGISYDKNDKLRHEVIKADDVPSFDLMNCFGRVFDFLESNLKQTNVLVHCMAGVSRSATAVIAYLIKTYNWTLQKALVYCRTKRKVTNPNPGFIQQLLAFESKLTLGKGQQKQLQFSPQKSQQKQQLYSSQFNSANNQQQKESNYSPFSKTAASALYQGTYVSNSQVSPNLNAKSSPFSLTQDEFKKIKKTSFDITQTTPSRSNSLQPQSKQQQPQQLNSNPFSTPQKLIMNPSTHNRASSSYGKQRRDRKQLANEDEKSIFYATNSTNFNIIKSSNHNNNYQPRTSSTYVEISRGISFNKNTQPSQKNQGNSIFQSPQVLQNISKINGQSDFVQRQQSSSQPKQIISQQQEQQNKILEQAQMLRNRQSAKYNMNKNNNGNLSLDLSLKDIKKMVASKHIQTFFKAAIPQTTYSSSYGKAYVYYPTNRATFSENVKF